MASTIINVRVNDQLKKQVKQISKEMGLSLSALVSGLLTKVVMDKKVEFYALTENQMTKNYEKELMKAFKDKKGQIVCNGDKDLDAYFNSIENAK